MGRDLHGVETVDVRGGISAIVCSDLGADEGISICVVQLAANLVHVGVVGLGFQPGICCCSPPDVSSVSPVEFVGGQAGLRPVVAGRARGDAHPHIFPVFTGGLPNHRLVLEEQWVFDVGNAGVVGGCPAGILHPVAEQHLAFSRRFGLHPDQNLQPRPRRKLRQRIHLQLQLIDLLLNRFHLGINRFAPLVNGQKTLAEEGIGAHQPVEIHTAVFDRERLIVEQQLFLAIEQHALRIDLVDALTEFVLFELQPHAIGRAFGACKRISFVPVADAENGEIAVACDAKLVGVDGRVELLKDQFRHACPHRHIANPLDLSALLVHHNVVDVGGDAFFSGIAEGHRWCSPSKRRQRDPAQRDEGEEWTNHGKMH